MNIKNYTSTVDSIVSMAKIEKQLVEIGAQNINKKYDNKICVGITFFIFDETLKQIITFHLKPQVDECFKVLWADVIRPKPETRKRITDQANRTAWKIICDWVEIQCSMILLKQAEPLQMFLPFMYDVQNDVSFYQKIKSGQTQLLLS